MKNPEISDFHISEDIFLIFEDKFLEISDDVFHISDDIFLIFNDKFLEISDDAFVISDDIFLIFERKLWRKLITYFAFLNIYFQFLMINL